MIHSKVNFESSEEGFGTSAKGRNLCQNSPRDLQKSNFEGSAGAGVTDDQWEIIKSVLPVRRRPWRRAERKGGRPRTDDRRCFNGLLWVLNTGGSPRALPVEYGSWRTLYRRLEQWGDGERLERMWRFYLLQLEGEDRLHWDEMLARRAKKRSFWLWRLIGVLKGELPR